jgi:hypothetical protein
VGNCANSGGRIQSCSWPLGQAHLAVPEQVQIGEIVRHEVFDHIHRFLDHLGEVEMRPDPDPGLPCRGPETKAFAHLPVLPFVHLREHVD